MNENLCALFSRLRPIPVLGIGIGPIPVVSFGIGIADTAADTRTDTSGP